MAVVLYNLPKIVVDNEDGEGLVAPGEEAHQTEEAFNPDLIKTIGTLKDSLSMAPDMKKSAIFADSLAESYRKLNYFDSAAGVYEGVAKRFPETVSFLKAADAYYEAYTFAIEEKKRGEMANRARGYYEQVLDQEPDNLDAKTNLGMIFVGTRNPMEGIGLLREVLEIDPTHFRALYNMGILSLQSNQINRAVERFEQLVQYYPENTEGRFYLGRSYLEAGNNEKAREQFEIVKETDQDPEVQAAVHSYLKEIE